MEINWFSPLPSSGLHSKASEYTTLILPSLSQLCKVVLWTEQKKWKEEMQKYAKIQHYTADQIDWSILNNADLNIYNIDSQDDYHYDIWKISHQCSGLLVLHDSKLQELFLKISRRALKESTNLLTQQDKYYLTQAVSSLEEPCQDDAKAATIIDSLAAILFRNAVGIVTHTKATFNSLSAAQISVSHLSLPYYHKQQRRLPKKKSFPPYNIVIFGTSAIHSSLEFTLKALSTFTTKNQFHLHIHRHLEDADFVNRHVQKLQVGHLVSTYNLAQNNKLNVSLERAHLAINLCSSGFQEEAMNNQLRIWSYALPSLVSVSDESTQELGNSVLQVQPGCEIENIQNHLRALLASSDHFLEIGKSAQKQLCKNHNPEIYVQMIVNMIENACKLRSFLIGNRLIIRTGREIGKWSDEHCLPLELKRLSEAIHFISS